MSELIVYTYNTEEKAAEVLQAVASMTQEHVHKPLIGLEDAAVVVKNAKGKVKVRQTLESVVKGGRVVSGGFWGMLIGFLFGGPIFGVLLGMGISALFGRKIDLGIDNKFIKNVGDELKPGDSALFLLVNNTPVETVAEAINPFGGNLYHTNLSKEAAEALSQVSETEAIAKAISADEEA
ncbi:MAG: DUF1269 domain-containing protein [Chloroflexi bacterium]|nr:DUF1269 domain-containing protein [Chloroflexota bacterium]